MLIILSFNFILRLFFKTSRIIQFFPSYFCNYLFRVLRGNDMKKIEEIHLKILDWLLHDLNLNLR